MAILLSKIFKIHFLLQGRIENSLYIENHASTRAVFKNCDKKIQLPFSYLFILDWVHQNRIGSLKSKRHLLLKKFLFFVIKVLCHIVGKSDKADEVTKTEVSKESEVRKKTSVSQFLGN